MTRHALPTPLLCLYLAACQAPPDAPVGSVGDTTLVASEAPARDTATLRELLRIGVLEGEPEYVFGELSLFTVGPDGDVFTAETEGEVRQYAPDGTFRRTVAGVGQGPGEVQYVVGMDVSADGRLALMDFGNQRISIYAPDGTFLRQVRRPPGRPAYGRDALRWDARGELWVGIHPPRTGPDTLESAGARPIYGRVTGDDMVADTVHLPPRAHEGCERRQARYASGFFEDGRLPYLRFAQWTRARDGTLAFGCPARYSIEVLAPDGGVLRISRAWTAPEIEDAQYDFWMEYLDEISRERPAYLRLWVADDGRIWARPGTAGWSRESTEEERARGFPAVTWSLWSATDGLDVFAADGTWLGHVRTPEGWAARPYPGTDDPLFLGDTVWAITTDEFDARYLSKFVVEWPG